MVYEGGRVNVPREEQKITLRCRSCNVVFKGNLGDFCPNCGSDEISVRIIASDSINIAHVNSAIDITSGTARTIKTIPVTIRKDLELEETEERINVFEIELNKLRVDLQKSNDEKNKLQEEYDTKLEGMRPLIAKNIERIEKYEESEKIPQLDEALEKLKEYEDFLKMPSEMLGTSALATMLNSKIDAMKGELTAKIEANTTIREAYEGVLEKQSKLLRWTIPTALATAFSPTILAIINWIIEMNS